QANVLPDNARSKTIKFSSANSDIVSVDSSTGLLQANPSLTEYSAVFITAAALNGVKAQIEVQVEILPTDMTVTPSSAIIGIGESFSIQASAIPSGVGTQLYNYVSSNTSIAIVKNYGVAQVTGVNQGEAIITVYMVNTSISKTLSVSVRRPVTGVSLAPATNVISVGQKLQLTHSVIPQNAYNTSVTYTSQSPDIATVNQAGEVEGISSGDTTITVSTNDGNFQATSDVLVIKPVTGVVINPKSIILDKCIKELIDGKMVYIQCPHSQVSSLVTPSDATNLAVHYSSSDENIVTVTNEGVVEGQGVGQANIVVTTSDGSFTDTCQVTIKQTNVFVQSLAFSPQEITINRNEQFQLNPIFTPWQASDKSLVYTSANPSVAMVSQTGLVTGISQGITAITAKSDKTLDGSEVSAVAEISVDENFVAVTKVILSPKSHTLEMGQTAQLQNVVEPANASDKTVSFSSSNTDIAFVSQTGLVTAKALGLAAITVTTQDRGLTDTSIITVVQPIVNVESIALTPSQISLNIDQTAQLNAVVSPDNATNKTVVWSSLDPLVASVDQTGGIFARSQGVAKIKATSIDGSDVFGQATVNVIDPTPIYIITDVSSADQARPFIEQMYIKKYTNGCFSQIVGNTVVTKYCPSDSVKREQMAAFLYNLKGKPDYTPPAVSPFSDLKPDNQFYKQIMWGVANGIWSGYEDKTFKGNKAITRGQFVSVLWRFYGNPEPILPSKSPFSDVKSSDSIYKAVIWAKNNSITTGYADGTFKPNKTCSRAQMAMFIIRSDTERIK
ncbi:MAG: Ig-like domain-containing protein, partial [Bifidobacteriaceae bacterium]|nr:Ig-like domain-containing protein [Bifidobacteriaceae bacterium]